VTGAGHLDTAAVARMLPRIRRHVRVPVGVGFGIRDAATAQAVAEAADAVVIGSRLVELLQAATRDNAASPAGPAQAAENVAAAGQAFIAGIRRALDAMNEGVRA